MLVWAFLSTEIPPLTELDIIMGLPECLGTTFLTEVNWTRHYSFFVVLCGFVCCSFFFLVGGGGGGGLHARMCPIMKLS